MWGQIETNTLDLLQWRSWIAELNHFPFPFGSTFIYLGRRLKEVYNFAIWPVCLRPMWRPLRRRRTDLGRRLMTSSWRAGPCCSLRCLWGWRLPLTGSLSFSTWLLCPWQLLFIHSCLSQRGFDHVNSALKTENIHKRFSISLNYPPFHPPAHCIILFCPSTIDELFNVATQASLHRSIERLSERHIGLRGMEGE